MLDACMYIWILTYNKDGKKMLRKKGGGYFRKVFIEIIYKNWR
jgi:hypothetical protein